MEKYVPGLDNSGAVIRAGLFTAAGQDSVLRDDSMYLRGILDKSGLDKNDHHS